MRQPCHRHIALPALAALVVLGIAATIAFQSIINLVVVTGLGPTKGIALPLVSAGGTGWILTAAMLGLVIALERADTPARTHTA